jgi:sugar phosphate isomerase/epimerase
MMMKLGYLSAILPELNYNEIVDLAAENGFKCVEVCCWPVGKAERKYAGVTHINVDELSDSTAARLIGYAEEKDVEVSGLAYYPNPLDPNLELRAAYIDHIMKVVRAAARLGVNQVNTFIGRDPKASIPESMTDFKRIWPDIVKLAEDFGVRIGIENCPMFFTMDEWPGGKNLAVSPKIWEDMFSIIDSPCFGLNYDPSHLAWQRMDYITPIYNFANKIFHAHIKDVKFYLDRYDRVGLLATPLEYMAPKIPGYGDIRWSEYFCALSDIHYEGAVVIEVEDRAFEESLSGRKKALLQSKEYIKQYLH